MNLNLGNYSITTNGLSIVNYSDSEVDTTIQSCSVQCNMSIQRKMYGVRIINVCKIHRAARITNTSHKQM